VLKACNYDLSQLIQGDIRNHTAGRNYNVREMYTRLEKGERLDAAKER
jgi:hypothetical protein